MSSGLALEMQRAHGGGWKRYPAYKDSGVEWLGEVPENWQVERLRFHISINPTKSEVCRLAPDTTVSFIPMEAVGEYGGIYLDQARPIEDVSAGYTYFREGDVVVAKITPCFENVKRAVAKGLTNGIGFGTTELHVLRPNYNIDRYFLFYLTLSYDFRKLGESEMYGSAGQKRVPEDFIKNLKHPIPTLAEQHAIAAFLDRETGRIDALIAKKERQIELLQEKRTALISHAVTRGLDLDAPMKDSGVEWLGEVPEHWEIMNLKRIGKVRYGLGQPPSELNDGVPLIRATNINRGKISDEGMLFINPDEVPESRDAVLSEGEIIIVRSGAYTGDSAIIPLKYAGAIAGYDTVLTIKKGINRYFAWQILSKEIQDLQFGFNKLRAAQPHLNADEINETIIINPLLEEQRTIAAFLDRETERIDTLTIKVRESISKLREYRTALISAAVTGKMDVRGELVS